MRHNKKKGMKLGVNASHTKAMKKGLVCALLANDRIKTTLPRAKAIRSDFDRIVTWAKKGDLASRRLAIAATGDAELVRETFEKAAQGMWADRHGGYTRIFKLGRRKGDNAEVVVIEVAAEPVAPKDSSASAAGSVKKVTKKAAAPKDGKAADKKGAEAEDAAHEDAAVAEDNAGVESDLSTEDNAATEEASDTAASEGADDAEGAETEASDSEDEESDSKGEESESKDEKSAKTSASSKTAEATENTAE